VALSNRANWWFAVISSLRTGRSAIVSDNQENTPRLGDALRQKVESAEPGKKAGGPAGKGGPPPRKSAGRSIGKILDEPIALFGPRAADLAVFCRLLATLLDVGIPLVRSLRILSERSQHPRLKKVAGQVAQDVEEGRRLSDALARHPRVFSALLINVARVGEAGGILEPSLNRLAETMEQKVQIRKKVIGACMYPVTALLVAFVVLVIIMTKAIPVFAEAYAGMNVELPGITLKIIALSNFASDYIYVYVPGLALLGFLAFAYGRTPAGKRLYDYLRLQLPILGGVNTKINVARSSRNLGNLLSAGVPLLEGLGIVARTSENTVIGKALTAAHDNVERGGKMDDPLRRGGVFPPMVIDMITIGDEAGALDTMLLKIADVYDTDVDTTLKGLSSLIEPLLIVLMGIVVIIIALAVLLPYFSLATAVGME
jgi:type IV pilus assembly protein PilC